MKPSVLITGANRGIGLEFVQQYAKDGWKVYATCRNLKKATSLQNLQRQFSNIHLLSLNVDSVDDIEKIKKQLLNIPLDVLINNAGIIGNLGVNLINIPIGELKSELLYVFSVNAVSPLLLSLALTENLKLGKLKIVVSISSYISSLSHNVGDEWNYYAYKTSKAALNMIMSCYSIDPNHADLRIILFDPGWVRTDMGGKKAPLSTEESVSGMRNWINITSEKGTSRQFIDYKGNLVPF